MLYHERERKNKEDANFVYIVYVLAKLCNIFDDAFFIDISIVLVNKRAREITIEAPPRGGSLLPAP